MDSLDQLKDTMQAHGVTRLYAKRLAANDNSKQQVYLGSNFDVLNLFPNLHIYADPSGSNKILKTALTFAWLLEPAGTLCPAEYAQLIFYPQYPEVRFSGFLRGCRDAPSALMTSREHGRVLFFGVVSTGQIIGYVVLPDHLLAQQALVYQQPDSLFIEIPLQADSRTLLLAELQRISELYWIEGKRLDGAKNTRPCRAPNCGGYTLEAELGITPNGEAKPDFLGWEVKQFSTPNIHKVKLVSRQA